MEEKTEIDINQTHYDSDGKGVSLVKITYIEYINNEGVKKIEVKPKERMAFRLYRPIIDEETLEQTGEYLNEKFEEQIDNFAGVQGLGKKIKDFLQ